MKTVSMGKSNNWLKIRYLVRADHGPLHIPHFLLRSYSYSQLAQQPRIIPPGAYLYLAPTYLLSYC